MVITNDFTSHRNVHLKKASNKIAYNQFEKGNKGISSDFEELAFSETRGIVNIFEGLSES